MRKHSPFLKPTLSQVLTFVIVCIAGILLLNLGQKWLICRNILAEKKVLAQELQVERAQRDALQQTLVEAESDAHIEQVIREDFGWVRDDEGSALIQYQDRPAAAGSAPALASSGPAGPPHWLDWSVLFLAP